MATFSAQISLGFALVMATCLMIGVTGSMTGGQREFDYFVLSLQWPGTVCHRTRHCCSSNACCRGSNAPTEFTIHGLWADYNDGTWPSCCARSQFDVKKVSTLLDALEKYWPSLYCGQTSTCFSGKGLFWAHEWEKHGTCSSPVIQDEYSYFITTLNVYFKYNVTKILYEAGYVPSNSDRYPLGGVVSAIENSFWATPEVFCSKEAVQEIRLCFYKDFKPRNCLASKTSCPKYVSFPAYVSMALVAATAVADATVDYNHVLYLHPSDAPGTVLVSHHLTGVENYSIWSRSMTIALRAKNKLGFVNGSCKKEGFPASLHDQWERCNALVLSWLINTVSVSLSAGIVFASNAAVVWQDLKERFDKVDGSRVYHLHREISTLVQGTSAVAQYYSKLRLLWDEFDSLVPISFCSCEGSAKAEQHIHSLRLFQFLTGLNETYSGVRSQILLMKPLPTVNQAYAMVTEDESQRQLTVGSQEIGVEPIAMYSSVGTSRNESRTESRNDSKRRFSGTCDHCHLKGHKKIDCFKLYPEKRKKFAAATHANNVAFEDTSSITTEQNSSTQHVPALTKAQYDQIVELLSKAPSSAMVNMATMANMANVPSSSGSLQWQDTGDW